MDDLGGKTHYFWKRPYKICMVPRLDVAQTANFQSHIGSPISSYRRHLKDGREKCEQTAVS